MYNFVAVNGELPAYHERMLIVKMKPTIQPMASFASFGELPSSFRSTPGISALATFERAGLIKRVTPLSRRVEEPPIEAGGRSTFFTLAASVNMDRPRDAHTGVNFIELEKEEDIPHLRNALAVDPNVEFVSRVPVRYLTLPARKPAYRLAKTAANRNTLVGGDMIPLAAQPPLASTMWNLGKIRWAEARGLSGFRDATAIRVAVLDTGVDRNHPDLAGRVNGYVFLHPDLPGASGEKDIVGHGTHVSGTIGALINNNLGINGICACQLHVWKIFTDETLLISDRRLYTYVVDPIMYHRALADCLDEGIDVINLSIGGPGEPDPQEKTLFSSLLTQGTIIVAAMGNERSSGSPISYPAAIPGVIAVGATSLDDTVADFSNRGNHIAVGAPGVAIWSTLPTYPGQTGFEAVLGLDGVFREGRPNKREVNYAAWKGTSMASPHVAAAVALLKAKQGSLTIADAQNLLAMTADKVPGMNGADFHPDYGRGRLNLLRLLSQ